MRRSTLVLVVLGAIAITVLWWVFVVGGVDERIADADAATQQLEIQRSSLESQLLLLQEAAESRGEYTRALATIADSVPAEPDMDVFIEDLKAIADRNAVDLVAIGASEPRAYTESPGVDVLVIDLDLAVEASFFELLGFLISLEDEARLIVVDGITVGAGGGGNENSPTFEEDVLTVNLTARLFAETSPVMVDGGEG
jgi:hypothetical protein